MRLVNQGMCLEGQPNGLLIYAPLSEKSLDHFHTPKGTSKDRLQMTGLTPCPEK